MKVAALLSLATLAAAAPAANKGVKVPFSRKRHEHVTRDDGMLDTDWFLGTLKHTILKYNKDFELPPALLSAPNVLKRATNAKEQLTDQVEAGKEDELYYGPSTIGKNQQVFTLDFDTGSSDTFVPGPQCTKSKGCVGTTRYDQTGQAEGNKTSITYGSGSVSGANYFDSVTVAGLTATHQNIVSLTTASGFSTSKSDGLMGMGFQSIAASKQPPYFFTLINEKKVNPTEFSFYLGRAKSGTQGLSELTLGGRDPSRYTGGFHKVPVTTQGYWQVAVQSANVGGTSAGPTTQGQAAIDTGTTLIIAPTAAATAIYAQIPGAVPLPGLSGSPTVTVFGYPCNSKPNVSFTLAGKQFSVNPLDFNFGEVSSLLGSTLCVGGIAGADIDPTENLYVLGDTFIKSWYATFSYNTATKGASVQLAQAK